MSSFCDVGCSASAALVTNEFSMDCHNAEGNFFVRFCFSYSSVLTIKLLQNELASH